MLKKLTNLEEVIELVKELLKYSRRWLLLVEELELARDGLLPCEELVDRFLKVPPGERNMDFLG